VNSLTKAYRAAKLRFLVSGDVDLADEATLATAVELLADLTPEDRASVIAMAVELGADPTVLQTLVSLVVGEVITVVAKPPRRWWPWLLAAATAGAAGGYTIHRVRRGRRRLGLSPR
jgi:hypothetical protein